MKIFGVFMKKHTKEKTFAQDLIIKDRELSLANSLDVKDRHFSFMSFIKEG